jgi:anionic cell wall polymer biosynthesis LytR-Cps2A-Psr (LCP) family protein
MNGETALLYARSRIQGTNSMPGNDFVRMGRQKCVMSAMLAQLSPANVAMNFANLADASGNVLVTSVPTGEIAELGALALKARELPIVSVSFTPPLIATGDPDFALIHQTVQQRIAEAEAADQPPAEPATTDPATTDPATTDPATTDPGTAVDPPPVDTADPPTDVADLQAECAA